MPIPGRDRPLAVDVPPQCFEEADQALLVVASRLGLAVDPRALPVPAVAEGG